MATSRLFRAALDAARDRDVGPKALVRPLTVRERLGALLLDHSGWVPSDLCDGVSVFVTHDVDLATCVEEALARIYQRVLAGGRARARHDGGLVVLTVRSDAPQYDEAVNVGAPIVGVCVDLAALEPVDVYALPDREHHVALPLPPRVLVDLIEDVTGERYKLSTADLRGLAPVDVLRNVHGEDGGRCVDRLRTASATRAEAVASVAAPVMPAAAVPPVVQHGAVRRLSEMTGFGEAGEWGINLSRDLAEYRAGRLPWSDVDRGILLSGPPGGGKTTFAKALGLECDLEVVPTNYGAWASGTGGDMVQRGLAKLFDQWREKAKKSPFILFWDEVDSVGRRNNTSHGDYWFGPIINSWLAFLDGAVPRDGVVVVGATNHPDNVDPALRRPGRMDRHLELPMPDVPALAGMVRMHLGADAVLDDADLAEAARAVRGRSPADVQQLCREARRLARWCGRRVCASDLTDVLVAQRLERSAADTRLTAVHEAGHAVAAAVLDCDPLVCVDIDAGRTSLRSVTYASPRVIEARMTMMLAARAAEEVVLGEVTTGAAQDIQDATAVATAMHGGWGMGAAGLVHVPPEVATRDPGLMRAIRATLDAAYLRALDLVREHRGAVDRVAQALVERRYLDAAEVRALVRPPPPTPPARAPGTGLRRLRAVAGP